VQRRLEDRIRILSHRAVATAESTEFYEIMEQLRGVLREQIDRIRTIRPVSERRIPDDSEWNFSCHPHSNQRSLFRSFLML
jgi:hypothetical protein